MEISVAHRMEYTCNVDWQLTSSLLHDFISVVFSLYGVSLSRAVLVKLNCLRTICQFKKTACMALLED